MIVFIKFCLKVGRLIGYGVGDWCFIFVYLSYLNTISHRYNYSPVGWGCRIRRLSLCRRVRHKNEYPGYDTKQSDGGGSVLKL